jgi:cell division protein FtsZ
MRFQLIDPPEQVARIRVIGVGNSGGNTVNLMQESQIPGVEYIAVNTDRQALNQSSADVNIQIGSEATNGFGSGGDPDLGKKAVEEDSTAISNVVSGCDLIFVTAGMGGGCGTGAAPVVAKLAKQSGALTIGIVTKPFHFENKTKNKNAEAGLIEFQNNVDALIVVPNDRLLQVAPKDISMRNAFKYSDSVLCDVFRVFYDLAMTPHQQILDLAGIRSIIDDIGIANMGVGAASGQNRAIEAVNLAMNSPLLESANISNSSAVLVNISGSDVGLHETSDVMRIIHQSAPDNTHVIFGYGVDSKLGDELRVSIIVNKDDTESDAICTDTIEPEYDFEVPEVNVIGVAKPKSMVAASGSLLDTVIEAEPECVQPAQSTLTFSFAADNVRQEVTEKVEEKFEVPAEDPVLPLDITPAKAERPAARAAASYDDGHSLNRKAAFRSDGFIPDLNEPAYTRKYQD